MHRAIAAAAATAALLLGLMGPAATPAAADPAGTGWNLRFSDEFNDSSVDTTKWNYRTDSKGFSAQRPQNVTESGGNLNINLKREQQPIDGMNYSGGGVVSKQALRYGYYETRAKINDGAGWHTSFWLMAGDGSNTWNTEKRTEIDGFEIDSIEPTKIRHNVITWQGPTTQAPPYYTTYPYDIGLDLRQWHTYGIDWREDSVAFYVDGTLKFTAPYKASEWMHDYTNIWLTTIGFNNEPDASKLPSSVQFDYVRYWQRDYYVDNDGPAAYGYSTTGTWQASSLEGWTDASPVSYACTAGAKATWRPNLQLAGSYEVYIWKSVSSTGGDPAAAVSLNNNGNVTNTTLDERSGTKGSWVSLGTQSYAAGTGASVSLTASGTGCAHADAVKFVRR